MPEKEDRFLTDAVNRDKYFTTIKWDILQKNHPDMDFDYIRRRLREMGRIYPPTKVEAKKPPYYQPVLDIISNLKELVTSPIGAIKEKGGIPSPFKVGAELIASPFAGMGEGWQNKPSPEQAIASGLIKATLPVKAPYREAMEKYPKSTTAGGLAGMTMAVPVASRITKTLLPGLARIPASAVTGAVYGQMTEPGDIKRSVEDAIYFAGFDALMAGLGKLVRPSIRVKIKEAVKDIPKENTEELASVVDNTLRNTLEPNELKAIAKGLRKQKFEYWRMRKVVRKMERERAGVKPEEVTGEGFTMRPERKMLEAPTEIVSRETPPAELGLEKVVKPESNISPINRYDRAAVYFKPKPEPIAEKPVAKLGINLTPAGEKLLENPTPITLEFIDWFKKTKPEYLDRAKLSTYTDGEPYFFLLGHEGARIGLRDFIKSQEVKLPKIKVKKPPVSEPVTPVEKPAVKEPIYPSILYKVDKPSGVEWYDNIVTAHQKAKYREKYGEGSFAVKEERNPEIIKDVINKGWVKGLKPVVKEPWQMTTEELKRESEFFDNKIQAERNRLDKIDPNRQRLAGSGIENLSPEDVARATIVNDELQRRVNPFSSAEAKERVQAKRKARLVLSEEIKVEKPAVKEPWQMTREDYLAIRERELVGTKAQKPELYYRNLKPEESLRVWESTMGKYHKEFIQQALSEGKPVPPEVLKDYPDLKPAVGEKPLSDLDRLKLFTVKEMVENVSAKGGTVTLHETFSPKWQRHRAEPEIWHKAYQKSLYPEWWQGRGFEAKSVLPALKNALEGKSLTPKQKGIVQDILDIAPDPDAVYGGIKGGAYMYSGFPVTKIIPEKLKAPFYQAKNRLKTPEAKTLMDEIPIVDRKQNVYYGEAYETANQKGVWNLNKEERELLYRYRKSKGTLQVSDKIKIANEGVQEVLDNYFKKAKELDVQVTMPDKTTRPIGRQEWYVMNNMKPEIAKEVFEDIVKARREAKAQAKTTGELEDQALAHIVDAWYRNSKFNPTIIKSVGALLKSGRARTPAEAITLLDEYAYEGLFPRMGSLERPKILPDELPIEFWETDMVYLLNRYMHGASKRLAEIEQWGQERFNKFSKGLSDLRKKGETEDARILEKTLDAFTGGLSKKIPMSKEYRGLTEGIVGYEVLSKIGLGKASIQQLTQPAISFMPMTRIIDWIKAGANMFKPLERSWARTTGAPEEISMAAYTGYRMGGTLGKGAELSTKFSGFQGLNKILQYWSSLTGKESIPHWYRMAKTSQSQFLKDYASRQLKYWGVDINKPLTPQALKEASFEMARTSQLLPDVTREMVMRQDPRFKFLFILKNFGYKQFVYQKDYIFNELLHGNPLPVLKEVALGTAGGEFVIWVNQKIKELITGIPQYREEKSWGELLGKPDIDIVKRIANNLAAVGTLGLVTNAAHIDDLTAGSVLENLWRTVKFTVTPAVISDIQNMQEMGDVFVKQFKRDKEKAIKNFLPKFIGRTGGVLANYLKNRIQTPESFDVMMKAMRTEVRQRAMDYLVKEYTDERGRNIIEKWNENMGKEYKIELDYSIVERERERRKTK